MSRFERRLLGLRKAEVIKCGPNPPALPTGSTPERPSFYRNYLLVLLITVYAFNYVDFAALGMALQRIKVDLHLSDTELGLLSGIAFWLFYATFGVPMGRWADRGSRVTVLFVTRILWAIFVILTGRAATFLQLLAIRAGAAVGESGCLPPSYSLISDHFSREERPRAMGLFSLGGPCAALLSFFASGWLLQLVGWRLMFTIIGLPGIVLAIIIRLTLKEPRNSTAAPPSAGDGHGATDSSIAGMNEPTARQPTFWQALRNLSANATYRNLLLAIVCSFFFSGSFQWQPTYFAREFGLTSGVLGSLFAAVYGVPGLVGTTLGGIVASRWAQRNERLQLIIVAGLYCSAGLTLTAAYLTRDYRVALSLIGLSTILFNLQTGPLFSALQTVVPSRLRAVSVTIVLFFANFLGNGLGPLFVGATSDLLRPLFGAESLRYALSILGPCFALSGWFVWRASSAVTRDIETATPKAAGLQDAQT